MQKLGIVLLLLVGLQVSLSSTFLLDNKRTPRSAGHSKHLSMKRHSQKKSWVGEFGEDQNYSKMSDDEISEMMMMKMRSKMTRMLQPIRDMFIKVLDLGPKQIIPGRPSFCGNRECPQYTVLQKAQHYELRKYAPQRYVSITMQDTKFTTKVISVCFWRLFKYIKQLGKRKFKMTTPVITLIKSDPTSGQTNITMSFYIPPSIVANLPTPTDNEVFIETKTFKVYAHGFSEFALREKTWKKHVTMLQRMLKKDGLIGRYHNHNQMYATASYDDPMKLFNPHNEVWMFATSE